MKVRIERAAYAALALAAAVAAQAGEPTRTVVFGAPVVRAQVASQATPPQPSREPARIRADRRDFMQGSTSNMSATPAPPPRYVQSAPKSTYNFTEAAPRSLW